MSLSPEYNYTKIGSASNLSDLKEQRIYRLLEIFPAGLSWLTLISVILISWLTPVFAAIFIIVFDIYWLLKTVYLALHLRTAFKKLRRSLEINWLNQLSNINPPHPPIGGDGQISKVKFFAPSKNFCGDNAAMIAVAGYINYLQKKNRRLIANGNLGI